METPPYSPQPVSPAPPYYPPVLPRPRENARMLTLGIFNVVIGFVYLVLAFATLIASMNYDLEFSGLAQMVAIGWAGFGLFLGGIQLLQGNASAATIIRSVFWVVLIGFAVSMIAVMGQVNSRYIGALIGSFVGQTVLFAYYPLIAFIVAGKLEDEYYL